MFFSSIFLRKQCWQYVNKKLKGWLVKMVSIEQVKCKLVVTDDFKQVKKYLEYHRRYKVILEIIYENNLSIQDEFTVIDIEHFVESEDDLQQYQFEIEVADDEFSYYNPEEDE